jgi:hypothetical protein
MTTYEPQSKSGNPLALLLILVLVIGVVYFAVTMPTHVDMLASTHAVIAHGQAAINAQNCFNGAGQVMNQVYIDPKSGKRMSFCNQHGQWFVSVDDCNGGNITCFPRSFAKSLRDCLDYAIRSGFLPPQ